MDFMQDPSWRRARYHCSVCSRPFDRKDTLSRHMQLHEKRRPQHKTRRKACLSCSQSKTRCDGERPVCSSCQKRDLTCTYENPGSNRAQQLTFQDPSATKVTGLVPQPSKGADRDHFRDLPELGILSPLSRPDQAPQGLNPGYLDRYGHDVADILQPGLRTDPEQDILFTTFDDTDFNSNLDWIFEDTNEGFLGVYDNSGLQTHHISSLPTISLSARQSDAGDDDVEGSADDGAAAEATPALGGLLAPQPQETASAGDLWSQYTPKATLSHTSLPGLGPDTTESTSFFKFYATTAISDRTWHALRKCVGLPFEHNPMQTLELDRFPPREQLEHCIDLYFAHFHPMLSVVHRPTFDPGKDLVVTLAIISIGACYTNLAGANAFSITLSELIRRLLIFMAEQDRRFVRTGSYLTAQLLQGTVGFCSGSERLFELSESCRSTLVHHAKCMGLFRSEAPKPARSDISLEEAWYEWVAAERLRRLGWAVYKYDASVSYLHNNRPFLSTGDINLNLPGSTEHWESESAQAWASLHPWTKTLPPVSRLRPTIRMLFDGTASPAKKIADEDHCFIIVLTLVRMLWTLKEIRSSPINDLVTPPIFDDGRKNLLRAIDEMAVPVTALSKRLTQGEMQRLVHRMHLVHIAHIYGAGDLMNWLYPYLRQGSEAETAKVRMKQWAVEDDVRVREVAHHSAKVLGLVRLYPGNMPLEPFLVFHAGVVLSCMAILLPANVSTPQNSSIQLDLLDTKGDNASSRQNAWVRDGGDHNVSLHGVPSLCCDEGRQQVLDQTAVLLKRQRVWGMAKNLTKVVLSLKTRDVEHEGPADTVSAPGLSFTL